MNDMACKDKWGYVMYEKLRLMFDYMMGTSLGDPTLIFFQTVCKKKVSYMFSK